MWRFLLVLLALAALIAIPFSLRPKVDSLLRADDTLVIVSPHNEAIRFEITNAFSRHYRERTGRTVRLDWRVVGGSSDIARYLKSEYYSSFKRIWTLGNRKWTLEVAEAFDNPSAQPADSGRESPGQAARRAFLDSSAGVGIDLLFGGGAFDFIQQARAGRLVDSGIIRMHPEWFTEGSIPRQVSGEPFYDPDGRWVGVCLASFGICYNRDSLDRLGIRSIPSSWADLADPRFFRQVALADPTKSGSAAKAFEMIIQQQMQEAVRASGIADEKRAIADGWTRGLRIIQESSANARYFTDAAGRVPADVSLGDAAIGMCIDFYGRFQSEAVQVEGAPSRLQYFTPRAGSSVGVDPIGILRGAPNRATAEAFIEFVLSIEGQKLWNFKVGTPGGPVRYALRRLPVRKELYEPAHVAFRSDPDVQPYEEAKGFTYHEAWTAPLFRALAFIIRVMCLDSHDEQVAAWKALIKAGFPAKATARFADMSAVDYRAAGARIRETLRASDPIKEVKLARELGEHFRRQYREVAELAEEAGREPNDPKDSP